MNGFNRSRVIIGILLVIIGGIFLLDNLGYDLNIPWYIFSWPIILVLIGVVNFLTGNVREGFILLGLGVVFYLDVFDVVNIGQLWPLILIIIGLSFLFRKRLKISETSSSNEDIMDEVAIFGGTERIIVSEDFKGGKITSMFGGSKIDLRDSKVLDEATIDLFCMFGGVEMQVPNDWKVSMNATAVFGGLSDERKSIHDKPTGQLSIKGFVMFGGVELKN